MTDVKTEFHKYMREKAGKKRKNHKWRPEELPYFLQPGEESENLNKLDFGKMS